MASSENLTNDLEQLRARHAALETAINAEQARPHPDELELHDLKKRKLQVKDQLARFDR
jgi:hypothetical protein